jgi:putative oxidoreductase
MTNETAAAPSGNRLASIALWLVKGLLALAFIFAAYLKLSSNPKMVTEFGEIGLGQGFRYLTGAIEVVGAALLLWPRTSFLGAVALLGICGGALIAQIQILHSDLVHVFVLGGLLALVAWTSRPAGLLR